MKHVLGGLGCLAMAASAGLTAREVEKASADADARLLQVMEAGFASWDEDQDGSLSAEEINRLVLKQEVRGEQAAVVAALKRAMRSRGVKLPPLTRENLRAMAAKQPPEKGVPDLPAMFDGSLKRIRQMRRELFAEDGPRLETIRQGRMGNCFSLAPLAALARQRPGYIREQMIRSQPDGGYEVRFGTQVVRVSPPTDTEIALGAGNEDGGLWVSVYEKAAGLAHNARKPEDRREALGLDALNRGGSAGAQLAFITGHEMFRISCQFAKRKDLAPAEREKCMAELRGALESATREGWLMTCGTLRTRIPGITPNHAYAILGYERGTDMIRLWNPHGDDRRVRGESGQVNGFPMKDGVFEMPLTLFVEEFSGTAYEILPSPAQS